MASEPPPNAATAGSADVDNFHIGNNGTNFFILTRDPRATFDRARPVLENQHQLDGLSAAYREAESKRYTVIWP